MIPFYYYVLRLERQVYDVLNTSLKKPPKVRFIA